MLQDGRRQLYRAVFMPVGVNLVFGAFNCRLAGANRRHVAPVRDATDEAAIAAFVRLKGVTRCPTAFAAPTRGTITLADQRALERHAIEIERPRRPFGAA